MTRTFTAVLLLVSAIAVGQEATIGIDPKETSVVEATQVDVDIITRLLEAAYTVVDPLHTSVDFPLYAYDMDAVLAARSCESFSDVPADHQFAFVSPVNQDEEAKRYIGVQVSKAAQIRDICKSLKHSQRILADELDEYLFTTEAQPQVFNEVIYRGVWGSSGVKSAWTNQCVKPFMTATAEYLPGKSIQVARPIPGDGEDAVTVPATVITQLAGETGWTSAVTVEWRPVANSEAFRAMMKKVAEKYGVEMKAWMVEPREAKVLTGQFFVTSYPNKDVESAEFKVPAGRTEPGFNLTAWYASPFCSTVSAHPPKWYVMSDRPLRHVKSDFRSWLASDYGDGLVMKEGIQ